MVLPSERPRPSSEDNWPLESRQDGQGSIQQETRDTGISADATDSTTRNNMGKIVKRPEQTVVTKELASQSSQPKKLAAAALNPLAELMEQQIIQDVDEFVNQHRLEQYRAIFRKGGLAAKTQHVPWGFEAVTELSQDDKAFLRYEEEHPWRANTVTLYTLSALCAGCAVVQGSDQAVINGAQDFYFREFKIFDPWMQGLINGAPYASAAVLGCWLNAPLNRFFGRRGTIAISCVLAALTAFWQGAAPNWPVFLSGRFVLGLAVGAKSATTPIYSAECAPKSIRGALVMMWQMFTAFGIMIGFAISLAFQDVEFFGRDSQWRWMLGVTSIPPLIVAALVFFMPESPRWYMDKGRFREAFNSLRKLRKHEIQAARDLYLAHKFLEKERQLQFQRRSPWQVFREFFTVRRNRRAAQSAWFCMFMQQFCGVNVIAYYSTKIFMDAGYSQKTALLVSFGTGCCNFVGALPAVFTIDRFGRRNLLVTTFPVMALLLAWTSGSFLMRESDLRLTLITTSLYLFMLLYSPGMGPVPFTYSAEAFPLHIRAVGMASATAITWGFNFLISLAWPTMAAKFTVSGGFAWYAAWNLFGFVFTYFFIPETKNKTLEQLDAVFQLRDRDHARYYAVKLKRAWLQPVGSKVEPLPPLYEAATDTAMSEAKRSSHGGSQQV